MKLLTQYLPDPYIAALDQLVTQGFYPSRAEAIRFAVHDLLLAHKVWHRTMKKEA